MKKMIALLLCLLGSSLLWAQENTVLGTGALSQIEAPKYAIKEIAITNPGSYSRPTINFGGHQVEWNYLTFEVGDQLWMEGEIRTADDLAGFVPTVVGGHGTGATVQLYYYGIDDDGNYVYGVVFDNGGSGYAPITTISPLTSSSIYLVTVIDENSLLKIYYVDYIKSNIYSAPPTVNISFGGAIAMAVLEGTAVNSQNTAIGYRALYSSVKGRENTALGHQALQTATGNNNIGLGYLAGSTLTTGSSNIFIGNNAGRGITTGSANVVIGGNPYTPLNSDFNGSVLIADGSGNPKIFVGDNGTMKVGYGTNFTIPANNIKLDVSGAIRTGRVYAKDLSFVHPQSGFYHDFLFASADPNTLQLRAVVDANNYPHVFSVDKPSASMTFYAPVKGVNAVNNNEFVTLGQAREINRVTTDQIIAQSFGVRYADGSTYQTIGADASGLGTLYRSFITWGDVPIHRFQGSSTVDLLVIKNGGNVGIGITDPQEKLAVNGKIRAREVKVEPTANWPDYVFEESYKPMSLAEISAFVRQYKHLPEVPSAKEVAQNGLELGEMNKILLKKIEELTLLLIDQNKKNEEQDELIKKMMAELKQQHSKKVKPSN
ncbi:hypothetical protein [Pedobacter sp.]|uniref:hypothetical protein n=1 Tax=Pedobacter sp. TaxID=1411316 RepID=UPI0031D620F0